jgi:hypothetical protein
MAFELTIHTIDNRPGFMLVIASRATCSHLVYFHLGLLRVVHFYYSTLSSLHCLLYSPFLESWPSNFQATALFSSC